MVSNAHLLFNNGRLSRVLWVSSFSLVLTQLDNADHYRSRRHRTSTIRYGQNCNICHFDSSTTRHGVQRLSSIDLGTNSRTGSTSTSCPLSRVAFSDRPCLLLDPEGSLGTRWLYGCLLSRLYWRDERSWRHETSRRRCSNRRRHTGSCLRYVESLGTA